MLNYPDLNPVALDLGVIQIHWYGISYIAGIAGAWWLLRIRSQQVGWISPQQLGDLVFYAMLGIIIGGRAGFVLFYNFSYYLAHPIEIFYLQQGGMSFHGGLAGVIIAMVLFARKLKQPFFVLTDFIAPVVPVGLFTGRIGNFINGELWGGPSQLPWAMVFPDPAAGGVARHPSQLYEALFEGVLLFLILWWFSMKPRPLAAVSGLFLFGYGVSRFLVEFVRVPDENISYVAFDWLTMGQILSTPMIIVGVLMFWIAYRKTRL